MKKFFVRGKGSVDLGQSSFIAKGGEGQIFGKGNTIYKIYEDLKKMIPEAKIYELQVLDRPNILVPKDIIMNKKNVIVGFTMDRVKDTVVLCKLFTNTFRDENDITNDSTIELVQNIRETIHFIHSKNCLIVDGNELNYLVDTEKFTTPYLIDVNSYQTPSFPATALMPSIRDWTSKTFSELTDWYGFAVVACQLFIGTHPYKGKHPDFKKGDLKARTENHISIFNPKVTIPDAVRDFGNIPSNYMDWFLDLFEKGQRTFPPTDSGTTTAIKTKIIVISSTNNFDIRLIGSFQDDIIFHREVAGRNITKTKKQIYVNNNGMSVSSKVDIVLTPQNLVPIRVKVEKGILKLKEPGGIFGQAEIRANEVFIINNALYARHEGDVYELVFVESTNKISALVKSMWKVAPFSGEVFDGVIFQSLLGEPYITVPIPRPGHPSLVYTDYIEELEGYKIIDAKHDNRVCMLIGHKENMYSRIILKFNKDYSKHTCRIVSDVDYNDINFVTLDSGVVVSIVEDGTMEVFSNDPFGNTIKTIKDPEINLGMRLCKHGTQLRFFKRNELYSVKMR